MVPILLPNQKPSIARHTAFYLQFYSGWGECLPQCAHDTAHGKQPMKLCKTDQIQAELAYLNGSLTLVEAVVCLIAAFPFGVLADIIGRKSIIFLSAVGSLLSLTLTLAILALPGMIPTQYILVSPLFNALGGGGTVLVANLYSILSDVVAETDRASAFFIMTLASLVGASIGPAISARLMEAFSPWVPVLLGFFVVPIGVGVLVFIPETFPLSRQGSTSEANNVVPERPQHRTLKPQLLKSLQLLRASIAMLQSPSIVLILATFLIRIPEVLATSQFFAQYVSKRFDWPLSKAGYLLTVRGIINTVILLVILPSLSKLLLRWQRPAVKDLTLARFSATFAATGAGIMAVSQVNFVVSGLALQTFGAGLAPLCRSLAASYLSPRDMSKLNTLIGIVETIGSLFAGPLKGVWLGLPYFGPAISFVLCLIGLLFVRSPEVDENPKDRQESAALRYRHVQVAGDHSHDTSTRT
ncbi:MFS general substrate transporter [Aspergillus avenaceus]|uniref:MFS general substrate transporter n=1 Tax=Aspergillus avenaceus TaxID=36643 RepID=A0A5N6TNT3_ASPAV|nr:MFS general substrate transporter [Aspergillus avenaceus]